MVLLPMLEWLNYSILYLFHQTETDILWETNIERPRFRYTFWKLMDTNRYTFTFRHLQQVRGCFGQSGRRNGAGDTVYLTISENDPGIPVRVNYRDNISIEWRIRIKKC